MNLRHTILTSVVAAVLGLAVVSAQGALIDEDFQSPLLGNGTSNPSFAGWTYGNGSQVKSRVNPSTGELPGGSGNQAIQFEYNTYAARDFSGTWTPGSDVFTLTVDVAPQSWNGTQDRFFAPVLTQGGTTWSMPSPTLMAHYSGTPTWETLTYYIPTTGFTPGTVELKLENSGFRGRYLDNVNLTVGPAPIDNTPPSPDPPTWDVAPTVFDYTNVIMSVNPVSDPSGQEYLFKNLTTTSESGWQDGTQWIETGLTPYTNYDYEVIARDKSTNKNATGATSQSAMTPTEMPGLIFASSFDYPNFSDSTPTPGFIGWQYSTANHFRSQDSPGDGVPGTNNQVLQFEQNSSYVYHDSTHGWSSDEVYTVSLNVTPQSWNGDKDRNFKLVLTEDNGTILWESGDVALPLYDNFGGTAWTPEQFFTFDIDASLFTTGTEGTPLSLRIQADDNTQRGMFIDNVLFTFQSAVAVPEPTSITFWSLFGLALAGIAYRRAKR